MSKLLCVVAVTLAALALFLRPAEPVTATPSEDLQFPKEKALRVTRKQCGDIFLTRAEVVRIGDRAFLSGYRVGEDVGTYVPVSDIDLIEEYPSVEVIRKTFRLPAPKVEAGPATAVEKK